MESKSFKQFLKMQEKEGNLIKLSQYKAALPEEYECYRNAYIAAREKIQRLKDRGVKGYTGFDCMSTEHILKEVSQDKTIPYPDKTYEESKKIVMETEARNQRIKDGKATHADFAAVTSEYLNRGK